ncbi:MAG: ParB/RepB/Spo0J family partition protein [Desulfobulbaceae bacterium]|nr:ParB/RepB/Spo0J family partition protein [Candidatus Kapabacteria bacterium]MBS4000100.1 ParB/RepB/Spo0J family partition protein [Desulfobulbaceae bacterium]
MNKLPKKKTGLGKGLGALISSVEFDTEKGFSLSGKETAESKLFAEINVNEIRVNPYQPRKNFDPDGLEDLTNSIKKHGILQPIIVRKTINGYELVSGERRLRASIEADLKVIPAYVLAVKSDSQMLVIALEENIQRKDLNPMEEAYGYNEFIEKFNYTQEQIAELFNKDRSTIANFLRLLRLPLKVQEMLREKRLSMGHARALLGLNDAAKMIWAGNEIIDKKLNVRETETLVKRIESGKIAIDKPKAKFPEKNPIAESTKAILNDKADKLRVSFGTNVRIIPKSKESGIIEFEFYSSDDLERLIELFDKVKEY